MMTRACKHRQLKSHFTSLKLRGLAIIGLRQGSRLHKCLLSIVTEVTEHVHMACEDEEGRMEYFSALLGPISLNKGKRCCEQDSLGSILIRQNDNMHTSGPEQSHHGPVALRVMMRPQI
jgi:hypothetical protein